METLRTPSIGRGICSALVALGSAATFMLVWIAKSLSHETRDLVSFAAFVVFVVAFNEALECFHRCRKAAGAVSERRG